MTWHRFPTLMTPQEHDTFSALFSGLVKLQISFQLTSSRVTCLRSPNNSLAFSKDLFFLLLDAHLITDENARKRIRQKTSSREPVLHMFRFKAWSVEMGSKEKCWKQSLLIKKLSFRWVGTETHEMQRETFKILAKCLRFCVMNPIRRKICASMYLRFSCQREISIGFLLAPRAHVYSLTQRIYCSSMFWRWIHFARHKWKIPSNNKINECEEMSFKIFL